MIRDLFDAKMRDGSRHFVDMPEVIFFDEFADHVEELEGAEIIEMWLEFEFHGQKFSVGNQLGDYQFFVNDANCSEEILFEVIKHFRVLLEK